MVVTGIIFWVQQKILGWVNATALHERVTSMVLPQVGRQVNIVVAHNRALAIGAGSQVKMPVTQT